jgi:hypothetical protein
MNRMKLGLRTIVVITLFILIYAQQVSAQYSRFALDAKVGTTFMMGSVSSLPGANSSLSLRYTPTRILSVNAFVGTGLLWGDGTVQRPLNSEVGKFYDEAFKFNTAFYTWGGSGYLNIQRLVDPRHKPKTIIPYVYAGMGYMRTRSEAESMETANHTIRYVTYFTTHVGIELKIKGTEKMDYLVSVQQNFTETQFLDGIPYDGKIDKFMSVSVGVSYKLNFSRKNTTSMDWTRDYYCCPMFRL